MLKRKKQIVRLKIHKMNKTITSTKLSRWFVLQVKFGKSFYSFVICKFKKLDKANKNFF